MLKQRLSKALKDENIGYTEMAGNSRQRQESCPCGVPWNLGPPCFGLSLLTSFLVELAGSFPSSAFVFQSQAPWPSSLLPCTSPVAWEALMSSTLATFPAPMPSACERKAPGLQRPPHSEPSAEFAPSFLRVLLPQAPLLSQNCGLSMVPASATLTPSPHSR